MPSFTASVACLFPHGAISLDVTSLFTPVTYYGGTTSLDMTFLIAIITQDERAIPTGVIARSTAITH